MGSIIFQIGVVYLFYFMCAQLLTSINVEEMHTWSIVLCGVCFYAYQHFCLLFMTNWAAWMTIGFKDFGTLDLKSKRMFIDKE
jgi:hypothetical protein